MYGILGVFFKIHKRKDAQSCEVCIRACVVLARGREKEGVWWRCWFYKVAVEK